VLDLFPSDKLVSAETAADEVASNNQASERAALFNSITAKSSPTGSVARSARLMALMKGSSKTPAKPAAVQ